MGDLPLLVQVAPSARTEELRRMLDGDVRLVGQEDRETPGCTLVVHDPPGVDALEQLARLQGPEGIPSSPVIVLSSGHDRRLRRAALRAGAMDVLDRDRLTSSGLLGAIEEAVERFSLLRRVARRSAERDEDA